MKTPLRRRSFFSENFVGIKKPFRAKITLQRKEVHDLSNKAPMRPEATSAMKQFKMEVANELGIPDYENMDKGNLSSREILNFCFFKFLVVKSVPFLNTDIQIVQHLLVLLEP